MQIKLHLLDRTTELAKSRSHETVTSTHVLVVLLENEEINPEEWDLWVDRAKNSIWASGSAIQAPILTEEAQQWIEKCVTLKEAVEVADELLLTFKDNWSEDSNEGGMFQSQQESEESETSERTKKSVEKKKEDSSEVLKVEEVLAKFDALVGMEEVKQQVVSLVNLHQLNLRREEEDLTSVPVGLHLVFSGNPGTGKTTVARLVAQLYQSLGLLPKGHLVEVQRADLIAGYVGQTAIKVQQAVKSAMGGVLFIDEAYALAGNSEQDFGSEAISTLVKMMEDNRDRLAVIAAGYEEDMEFFINSNAGLKSRFQRYVNFRDFDPDELVQIFEVEAINYEISVSDEVREVLLGIFESLPPESLNGNGRFARNLFEHSYAHMASRVNEDGVITEDELKEGFAVEDIPKVDVPEKRQVGFHR